MHSQGYLHNQGDMYIRVSVVKPCINSDVHSICEFSDALQWNCSLGFGFHLDRISQDQWDSGSRMWYFYDGLFIGMHQLSCSFSCPYDTQKVCSCEVCSQYHVSGHVSTNFKSLSELCTINYECTGYLA